MTDTSDAAVQDLTRLTLARIEHKLDLLIVSARGEPILENPPTLYERTICPVCESSYKTIPVLGGFVPLYSCNCKDKR